MACTDRRDVCFKVVPILLALLVVMLPTIGIIPLGEIDYADRYSYIPSAFLIFIVVYVLQGMWRGPGWFRLSFVFLVIYGGLLVMLFVRYLPAWSSVDDYWKRATVAHPASRGALLWAGFMELEKGNYPEVVALSKRMENDRTCREERGASGSGHFYAVVFFAEIGFRHGQSVTAEKILLEVYPRLMPARVDAEILAMILNRLIACLISVGDYSSAKLYIRRFLTNPALKKNQFECLYYQGLYAGFNLRLAEAEKNFNAALALRPNYPAVLAGLDHIRRMKAIESAGKGQGLK